MSSQEVDIYDGDSVLLLIFYQINNLTNVFSDCIFSTGCILIQGNITQGAMLIKKMLWASSDAEASGCVTLSLLFF